MGNSFCLTIHLREEAKHLGPFTELTPDKGRVLKRFLGSIHLEEDTSGRLPKLYGHYGLEPIPKQESPMEKYG